MEITLKKCTIVGTRILSKSAPEKFSIGKLVEKFVQSGARMAKNNLLALREGDYVGLTSNRTHTGHPSSFVLLGTNGNDISGIIKKNPGFETKILEIYRVEDVTMVAESAEEP